MSRKTSVDINILVDDLKDALSEGIFSFLLLPSRNMQNPSLDFEIPYRLINCPEDGYMRVRKHLYQYPQILHISEILPFDYDNRLELTIYFINALVRNHILNSIDLRKERDL
jgi:hypothetical protein